MENEKKIVEMHLIPLKDREKKGYGAEYEIEIKFDRSTVVVVVDRCLRAVKCRLVSTDQAHLFDYVVDLVYEGITVSELLWELSKYNDTKVSLFL